MKSSLAVLLLASGLCLQAQSDTMTVEQLADTVRSELALKQHTDKQIAAYVKKLHLTEQLSAKTIEDLEEQGAGPKTVEALKALREESLKLKAPTHDSTYSPATAPEAPVQPAAPHITNSSPIPPPDSVKQAEIVDAARAYARSYTANLPNFVCVEVMRRYAQFAKSDDYRSVGTVLAKLTYNQGREDYKVYSENGKYVDEALERVAGPYSRGDFGTIMHQLFSDEGEAEIGWDHWATLRGRKMAAFNYRMESAHSGLTITDEVRTVHAGAKGLFYVDADTGTIYRITQTAFDIPQDFSVRAAEERLDYDDVDISGQKFLVPLKAEVLMTSDRGKLKLGIEFRSYRKFGTESNITYGDLKDAEKAAPLPATQTEEQPAKPATPAPDTNSNPFGLPSAPPPPPK
jgi:hypothetical protein